MEEEAHCFTGPRQVERGGHRAALDRRVEMPASKRKRKPTAKAQAAKATRTSGGTRASAARTQAAQRRANRVGQSTEQSEAAIEPNPNVGEEERGTEHSLVFDLEMLDLVAAAKKTADSKDIDKALRSNTNEVNDALRKLIVGTNVELREDLQDKNPLQLAAYAQDIGDAHSKIMELMTAETEENALVTALQDMIIVRRVLNGQVATHAEHQQDTEDSMGQLGDGERDAMTTEVTQGSANKLQEQEQRLQVMDVSGLIAKATELEVGEDIIDSTMGLKDMDERKSELIKLITEAGGSTDQGGDMWRANTLSTEQRQQVESMTFSQLNRLRVAINIQTDSWTQAVNSGDTTACAAVVTVALQDMSPVARSAALAAITAKSSKATNTVAKNVTDALMSAARREVIKAAGKATDAKAGHIASAKMIQAVMKSGARLPAPSRTLADDTFDQQKFKMALDNNDKATWTQMLADHETLIAQVLREAQGHSSTLNELIVAAQVESAQGKAPSLTNWIDMQPVAEPGSDYDGNVPRIKSKRLPAAYRNTFFPGQFDSDRKRSASDELDEAFDTEVAGKYDSDRVKSLKAEEAYKRLRQKHSFKSTQEWREAADRLEEYCANTLPPLLPAMSAELHAHQRYVRTLIEEMKVEGANEDTAVMKIFVIYDEEVRMKKAKATVDTCWTDEFTAIRTKYLTRPLRQLQRQTNAEVRKMNTELREQMTELKKRRGKTSDKSKAEELWERVKDIAGAEHKHLFLNKKGVCASYCVGSCKKSSSCWYSHHCLKCGKKGHSITDCKN